MLISFCYLVHSRDELHAEVELLLTDAKEDGTSIKVGSRYDTQS